MIRALDKVSSPLEESSMGPLNKVAVAAFAKTSADVHVITGKLRTSGRLTTNTYTNTWHMKIRYVAYRKNFNYAYYEMKVRQGSKTTGMPPFGPHDPFVGLEELVGEGITKAIDHHMAPMKGR
jgi:hypothetical protein